MNENQCGQAGRWYDEHIAVCVVGCDAMGIGRTLVQNLWMSGWKRKIAR
jgi:hypothetical protein